MLAVYCPKASVCGHYYYYLIYIQSQDNMKTESQEEKEIGDGRDFPEPKVECRFSSAVHARVQVLVFKTKSKGSKNNPL